MKRILSILMSLLLLFLGAATAAGASSANTPTAAAMPSPTADTANAENEKFNNTFPILEENAKGKAYPIQVLNLLLGIRTDCKIITKSGSVTPERTVADAETGRWLGNFYFTIPYNSAEIDGEDIYQYYFDTDEFFYIAQLVYDARGIEFDKEAFMIEEETLGDIAEYFGFDTNIDGVSFQWEEFCAWFEGQANSKGCE